MSKTESPKNVFGFLAIAIGATACATLLLYFVYLQPRASHLATQSWVPTECHILALKLFESIPASRSETRSANRSEYSTADIRIQYRYSFGGQTYESTQYDLLKAQSGEDAWAREAYVRLSKADTTTCYVNPENPSQAVIDRERKHPQIAILLPIIFYGIGLVFFLLLIGEIRKKSVTATATPADSRDPEKQSSAPTQSVAIKIVGVLGLACLATIAFLAMDGFEHSRSLYYGTTDWVKTDGTVDWSRASGTRIFGESVTEFQVRYDVEGTEYTDRCYAFAEPSEKVIEYDREHHWRGRLQGTKLTSTPITFLLLPAALFGLLALCLVGAIMRGLSRLSIALGISAGMVGSKALQDARGKHFNNSQTTTRTAK